MTHAFILWLIQALIRYHFDATAENIDINENKLRSAIELVN